MKTPKPQKRFAIGYWENSNVPPLDDILAPHKIDAIAFSDWLGPLLGTYRGSLEVRQQLPTATEEHRYAVTLNAAISELSRVIAPMNEPTTLAAHLALEAHKLDLNWSAMRDAVRMELVEMQTVLARAAKKLPKPKAGRPDSSAPRDALVAAVVNRLQEVHPGGPMKVAAVHALAQEVLVRCRVAGMSDVKRALSKAARPAQ